MPRERLLTHTNMCVCVCVSGKSLLVFAHRKDCLLIQWWYRFWRKNRKKRNRRLRKAKIVLKAKEKTLKPILKRNLSKSKSNLLSSLCRLSHWSLLKIKIFEKYRKLYSVLFEFLKVKKIQFWSLRKLLRNFGRIFKLLNYFLFSVSQYWLQLHFNAHCMAREPSRRSPRGKTFIRSQNKLKIFR